MGADADGGLLLFGDQQELPEDDESYRLWLFCILGESCEIKASAAAEKTNPLCSKASVTILLARDGTRT